MRISRFFTLLMVMLSATFANAQNNPMDRALPIEESYKIGVLENGMTYYIMSNPKPEGSASFFIAHNVGAINEADHQDGLAHFLEHMAFNGTKNFPGKGIINYIQSLGGSFGKNINAFTATDMTVYMLTDIPLKKDNVVDSALLILHDWSHYITLDPDEVNSERGVILEELRTGNTSQRRVFDKMSPVLFNGTKYKDRTVIGTEEGLKTFKQESIEEFYHDWYHPANQAIVIVGDIDVELIEAKVKALFSKIPVVENIPVRENIVIPQYDEDIFYVVTDSELQTTNISISTVLGQLGSEGQTTYTSAMIDIIKNIIGSVLGERFSDIANDDDAPFMGAGLYISTLIPSTHTISGYITTKEGEMAKGLERYTAEIERLKKHGITQAEYDRAVTSITTNNDAKVKGKPDRYNSFMGMRAVTSFLTDSHMMSPEQEQQVTNELLMILNKDLINNFFVQLTADKHSAIMVASSGKEGVTPTEQEVEAAYKKGLEANLPAPEEQSYDMPLITEAVTPGSILSEDEDDMGNTVWKLSNGATVTLRPSNLVQDDVALYGERPGGYPYMNPADKYAYFMLTNTIGANGMGDFTAQELSKALSGKLANTSIGISTEAVNFSGASSAKLSDIEAMMQMIYLRFTAPRLDETPFNNRVNNLKSTLPNYYSNPIATLQDTAYMVSKGYSPYLVLMRDVASNLDDITLEDTKRIYSEQVDGLSGAQINIIGQFEIDSIRPLVESYIASIPSGEKRVHKSAHQPYLKGDKEIYFNKAMENPAATVVVLYSGYGIKWSVENDIATDILTELLTHKYTDIIREERGASYGIGVSGSIDSSKDNYFTLSMQFDTNAKDAKEMSEIIDQQVDLLASGEIDTEDFAMIKEAMLKDYDISLLNNKSWASWMSFYQKRGIIIPDSYRQELLNITPETVVKLAAKIKKKSDRKRIIMYPEM